MVCSPRFSKIHYFIWGHVRVGVYVEVRGPLLGVDSDQEWNSDPQACLANLIFLFIQDLVM